MNSTTQQTGNQLTLTITAEESDLTPTVKSVYNRLRQTVEADGFRTGKAPNHIIDRELGGEKVQAEVIDAAADKLYRQALEKHDIRPIGRPHVAVKKFAPYSELELEITVEIMPEVTLPDYTKIKQDPNPVEAGQEEVDEVLESLRERMADREPLERPAQSGDEVTIDFRGQRGGEDIPGAQATDYAMVLGGEKFIPGFEEELIGMSAGEDKQFSLTFPAEYPEPSLAGQSVDFEVSMKQVASIKKPELNDEFAQTAGPFSDLENLRQDIYNHLQSEKQQSQQKQLENDVLSAVVAEAGIEVPESMLEQERERVREDISRKLAEQQLDEDSYLEQTGKTRETYEDEIAQQARERVKTALVLTEVAKAEGLSVSPDELDVRLQVIAGQYNDDKVQEEIQKPEVRQQISDQMLAEKTVQTLVEYATAHREAKAEQTADAPTDKKAIGSDKTSANKSQGASKSSAQDAASKSKSTTKNKSKSSKNTKSAKNTKDAKKSKGKSQKTDQT